MSIQITPYGTTRQGQAVQQIALQNGPISCTILTYGGAIATLIVPDRAGNPVDVVLGYDNMAAWEAQNFFINALIGRCGNRIGGGAFTLGGVDYTLALNNGPNSLHGGNIGFDKKIWAVEATGENWVTLHLDSPHMEEGFPGNLSVSVTYTLNADGLAIRYVSTCDQDTICNLTNHAYFNLNGHNSGFIGDQLLQLHAQNYTPADDTSIPTGEIAPVAGTPMDFTSLTPMGQRMESDFQQLHFGCGYDHNWVIDGDWGSLRPAALAVSNETGIAMETATTCPGIQFYAGNFVTDTPLGKGGTTYGRRHGFCLETQFHPDSIHIPQFPQPILKAGETQMSETVYRFYTV